MNKALPIVENYGIKGPPHPEKHDVKGPPHIEKADVKVPPHIYDFLRPPPIFCFFHGKNRAACGGEIN